jgi:hypothetical protein
MVKNVKVNLVIIQPGNHLHSLALLDVARYFRFHLRRMGATVFISKNRLYKDAINIIFGAHLGVPKDWLENFRVIIANLGEINKLIGQSRIDYITLLRENAVIEHNPNNISNYRADVTTKEWQKVPVFQFDHAPYLKSGRYTPLETRPIDLLFIGSMNEYRKSLVQEIQQCGVSVSTFDLYCSRRLYWISHPAYHPTLTNRARSTHCRLERL